MNRMSQVGVDRAHQQRAVEQVRKPARASEVRTINAQIGVQPATIDVQLDGQIDSQGRVRRWLRVEGKIKGTKVRFS